MVVTTAPTDVTPTPTEGAKATIPVQDDLAGFAGTWSDGQGSVLELGGDGLYSLSRGSRQPETGTWSVQEDGSLALEGQSFLLIPHGNFLLLGGTDGDFTLGILQRAGDDGELLPYEPSSAIEVPPMDPSAVLSITIADDWTGYSPLAPIEAHYHLEPDAEGFSGMAEFSVAGYTDAISRSVPISIPLAVVEELLALLVSTPLETGVYKRVFSHTDDFPRVTIAVEHSAGEIEFSSESQGSRHIPWRVVVGEDQYITYADTPVQALDLLNPHLARDVQEALFDLALARDY
jgi:hypothetical protein